MAATPNPTLYVTAAVNIGGAINFWLYAVDITTGLPRGSKQDNPVPITGSVSGLGPSTLCSTDYPGNGGSVDFEYHHIQRSGLLLLGGNVYVAFSAGKLFQSEDTNGWIFGYLFSYANNTFTQTSKFNSTPYGTGGGFWGSGAGLASDVGANPPSIYTATGNGTFDLYSSPASVDTGDSLLKLNPSNFAILSFYTPPNVLSFSNNKGTSLCHDDEDFGSGGVLVVPSTFTYNGQSVVITGDKQSNLYVSNQANLGGFNANTDCTSNFNNVQCITTPSPKVDDSQGYWGSPAYWHYNDGQDHYMLYYSATTEGVPGKHGLPINGYSLLRSGPPGPIPSSPTASTMTLFCERSPTPSGSSNGTSAATGIVWAIEHQRVGNPQNCVGDAPGAALHAFKANDLTTELYSSRNLQNLGYPTKFSTPTVFKGRVYVGTQTEVDVYGLQ